MRTVLRNVYYCSHCKLNRLSRRSMEKHELHCTMNPERICGWAMEGRPHTFDLVGLARSVYLRAPLVSGDVAWVREQVKGCPACMLSVLRQSGVEYHYELKGIRRIFDYKEEVERFRKEEVEAEQYAEMRYIEGQFL